ncbi:MAG: YybH family protein [Acidimicrobiales bacterium]
MATPDPNDILSLPQADQEAIGTTLISLLSGFQERNADKLVGIYTSDADWVNAFGSVKKGGGEIVEYLRGLFSDDNFNAGTLKAPPETSIRVLTPDVVLVSAHLQVEGQKLVGGGEIEERDNYSLRVLQRQSDGTWLIVSEMYNDANRETTYENHS